MGEEVKVADYGGGDDDERMVEWEDGLPSVDDLTPLSQMLIPPELASAFKLLPGTPRTMLDVNRASRTTFSLLRSGSVSSSNNFNFKRFDEKMTNLDMDELDLTREGDGSDSRKTRRMESEDSDSSAWNNFAEDQSSAKATKRPRLVWTPQLHKRFVDVVAHLGIKNAVPKTIMQLMNVEGLTRENVASHLQKYRLYLKRMQGLTNEGPTSSDHLFESTPVPQSLDDSSGGGGGGSGCGQNNGNGMSGNMGMPMMYPPPGMVPMPMFGMAAHGHGSGHLGMTVGNSGGLGGMFHYQQYSMDQQREWASNHHRVAPNHK